MLTDATSRTANRAGFLESNRIKRLDLPPCGHLPEVAKQLEIRNERHFNAEIFLGE